MKAEEFVKQQVKKHGDNGILAPLTTDREGLEALIEHFLGEYISVNPIGHEQYNTEAIFKIMQDYPGNEEKGDYVTIRFKKPFRFKNLFK